MKFEQNDIIVVKLVTGEEVIGRIKKKYHDGGFILDDTRVLLNSEFGCCMERFIPYCENDDYELAPHAIIAIGRPIPALIEFFNKGEPSLFSSDIAMQSQAKH